MSPRTAQKPRRLVLHRETIRTLENPSAAQLTCCSSEQRACTARETLCEACCA